MTDVAFEVTYGCENCGNEWSTEHTPRTSVRDSTPTERVRVCDEDCTEIGFHQCDCCWIVSCSVCELDGDVYVDDREPIEADS